MQYSQWYSCKHERGSFQVLSLIYLICSLKSECSISHKENFRPLNVSFLWWRWKIIKGRPRALGKMPLFAGGGCVLLQGSVPCSAVRGRKPNKQNPTSIKLFRKQTLWWRAPLFWHHGEEKEERKGRDRKLARARTGKREGLEQVLQYQKDKLSLHVPILLDIQMVKKPKQNKKYTPPHSSQLNLSASPTMYYLLRLASDINFTSKIFMALYTLHSPPVPSNSSARHTVMHNPSIIHTLSSQLQSKHLKSCSNKQMIWRKKTKTRTGFLSFIKTTQFIPKHSWQ